MVKGLKMAAPRMGLEGSLERLGWVDPPAPGTEKPKSGLQILASGLVRGAGQALGPCASPTRDREMAKDFL